MHDCRNCGKTLKEDWKGCPYCVTPVSVNSDRDSSSIPEENSADEVSESAQEVPAASMSSTHPRVAWFVRIGFFDGVTDAETLFQKISDLEEPMPGRTLNQTKGDALEIFGEAYLRCQPQFDALDHYMIDKAPKQHIESLALETNEDEGVDGVFRTHRDTYCTSQMKWRSEKPVTYGYVKHLLSESHHAERAVFITNMPRGKRKQTKLQAAIDRGDLMLIGRDELMAISESDFAEIIAFINGSWAPRERLRPDEEERLQETAIRRVVEEEHGLTANDRCRMVAVSAAGKTLTGMFIAEEMDVQTLLVLVPSRPLVRQTIKEYLPNIIWDREDFEWICVSSDAKAIEDERAGTMDGNDVTDIPTTNPEEIAAFLARANGKRKVVVTTYHSARQVALAMEEDFAFDLAIFDEAHRTAQFEDGRFTLALRDRTEVKEVDGERVPNGLTCRNRLFMTATERIYDDKESADDVILFSMDDVDVYGEVAHRLTYEEAVELGIIVPIELYFAVITDADLAPLMDVASIKGMDDIGAREYATAVAIRKMMQEHDVQRAFTFHNFVKDAESVRDLLLRMDGLDCNAYSIRGETSVGDRESAFKTMSTSEKPTIITSVGTIREGVNVPAVEMVVIAAPRKDPIDVTQISGRPMRRYEGKEKGLVLVPILIEQKEGESEEEMVKRAGYESVGLVLGALRDTVPILHNILRDLGAKKARDKAGKKTRTRKRIMEDNGLYVIAPTTLDAEKVADGISLIVSSKFERSVHEFIEEFRIHLENGGNAWVPAAVSGFGLSAHLYQKAIRKILAGELPYGTRGLTKELISILVDDLGFLLNSPTGIKGRPKADKGADTKLKTPAFWVAAVDVFKKENKEKDLKYEYNETAKTIVGPMITVEWDGELFTKNLGRRLSNMKRKNRQGRMAPEECYAWAHFGFDMDEGFSEKVMKNFLEMDAAKAEKDKENTPYDQSEPHLRKRLEDRDMTQKEHAMWVKRGKKLPDYDSSKHTPSRENLLSKLK